MVKNIAVLAKGINQFLTTINSPLKNNMDFAFAVALSQLRLVSSYFQNSNNLAGFASCFSGYTPRLNYTLNQYIDDTYNNNINNVGPLP